MWYIWHLVWHCTHNSISFITYIFGMAMALRCYMQLYTNMYQQIPLTNSLVCWQQQEAVVYQPKSLEYIYWGAIASDWGLLPLSWLPSKRCARQQSISKAFAIDLRRLLLPVQNFDSRPFWLYRQEKVQERSEIWRQLTTWGNTWWVQNNQQTYICKGRF